jgi:hypothetical protein
MARTLFPQPGWTGEAAPGRTASINNLDRSIGLW